MVHSSASMDSSASSHRSSNEKLPLCVHKRSGGMEWASGRGSIGLKEAEDGDVIQDVLPWY